MNEVNKKEAIVADEPLTFEIEENCGVRMTWRDLLQAYIDSNKRLKRAIKKGDDLLFDPDNADLVLCIERAMSRAASDIEDYARGEIPI